MEIDAGYYDLINYIKDKWKLDSEFDYDDHISVHINITDMGNRPFYIEVDQGRIKVEPYGYYNSDAVVNADSQLLYAIINRQIELKDAYTSGRLGAFGNLYKLAALRDIIREIF